MGIFFLGLVIGLIVGGSIGMFVTGLLLASSEEHNAYHRWR